MTEQELENVRIRLQVEAVWTILRGFLAGAIGSKPDGRAYLLRQCANLRQSTEQIAIPWAKPEWSDLISAEFQTALESFLSDLEKQLNKAAQ